MRKAILLATLFIAMTWATDRADAAVWLIAGSGCVADQDAVQAGNYRYSGPFVEFQPGFIGSIRLYCPVTPGVGVVDGFYNFDLYSADNGAGMSVRAELFRMHLGTGGTTIVAGCDVTSDTGGQSGYQIDTGICEPEFDPDTYLYFARVTVTRTAAAQVVRFYGLSLVQ